MTTEIWTDERLNQLATLVAANNQQIAANSQQIAANSQQLAEYRLQMESQGRQIENQGRQIENQGRQIENQGRQIENLRVSITDLREGQAMLTQMFAQEQASMQEFRQTTRAALDRIDRTLDYLMQQGRH